MDATGTAKSLKSYRPEQLWLFFAGGLLVASGCLHVLVWMLDGGSLSGSVSWRKPILFGFSAGATLLSMGWVVGKMKRRWTDLPLFALFAVAMLVEVGLITLQQWRGVASHFNRATPFDGAVLAWIEWLILFATLVIAETARRSFHPLAATSDIALAVRAGMAYLLFACLLGFVLVWWGEYRLARDLPPETYPPAGVMKFPHGVPIHAIQYLPLLAWALRRLGVVEHRRLLAVACAVASTMAFTAFSLLQTFTGRSRFDVDALSAFTLLIAAALMAASVGVIFFRGARKAPSIP